MSTHETLGGALVALLVGWTAVVGQEPDGAPTARTDEPTFGHSAHGEAFNDGPRQNAYLMDGMGRVAFPVTTDEPEVQTFINQGVAQLHSFLYFEAERSFRQAAMIDPDCTMAYWGMAMANTNNADRAQGFLAEARKRIDAVTPREALHIEALAASYQEGADDKTRRQQWLQGLERIVQEYPDDIDARAWLVMVAWRHGPHDGIGSRQALDMVLDTVLAVDPMHPGAHHYRIHLWDGHNPQRALSSAALYAQAAPGIAHAWHMPGHTYTELKRFADAAYQQEGSARVDHAYMIRDRVMPFEIHNYAHNNQWLAESLTRLGRVREALAVARNLVEQPRDPEKNNARQRGSAQREGRRRWAEALVHYELWDELIATIETGALDWSDEPEEQRAGAHALGLAFAAQGDADRLAEPIGVLQALRDQENAKDENQRNRALIQDVESALAELQGYQKLLAGDGELVAAFEQFGKARSMAPERLARAHVSARNFGFAESLAAEAVAKRPNEVPPLAAQVEILDAVGKTQEAQNAYRKLRLLAADADLDLPVFQRLAAIVERWQAEGSWKAEDHEETRAEPAAETEAAEITRIDLTTLGPLTWSPFPAAPLALADSDGNYWDLADRRGKNVVLVFFLGGECAHCMQQLQLFGEHLPALEARNAELVAVSTDDAEATRWLRNNPDGIAFPMPILPDPGLETFRRYRVHDDFENQPLHGTFLIDGDGHVRYQNISADPFLEIEFVKDELERVNRMRASE